MIIKNKDIIEFIEQHIDLIDANKFQEVYDEVDDVARLLGGFNTCDFTEALLAAGIDPMPYLVNIPQEYLTMSQIPKHLVIPSNIKFIGKYAFDCCPWLETVVIEEGCEIIDEDAFVNCGRLKTVTLPVSLKSISNSAFEVSSKPWLKVKSGSHAHEWAVKHHFPIQLMR